jgi:hypothetical protein
METNSPLDTGLLSPETAEREVRSGFIRKVYGILSAQLVLTAFIAFPISQMSPDWVAAHVMYLQGACIASLVLMISVICCINIAKQFPYNYVFLFTITVLESVIVGFVSAMYTTESVLVAALMTGLIFGALTAYAFTTKSDFTGMGPYLLAFLIGLTFTSFLCMFYPSPMAQKVIAGAGAILFSFYIVYDTQLIAGGKHQQQIGIDDYVFAALNIYLDIIQLFLQLLALFGERK